MRYAASALLALLSGCSSEPAPPSIARVTMGEREAPLPPILTPDTTGAVWAPATGGRARIVYGKPGQAILFSLACSMAKGEPQLGFTRHAAADAHAKAMLALIGNRYVSRLKIDAVRDGARWTWSGSLPAHDPSLDVLVGGNRIEATVPGAGSLILNASTLPGEFLTRCRSLAPPRAPAPVPAAMSAVQPEQEGTTGTAALPPPPAR